MEKVTIYDESDRPYLCLVEGTRVIQVLQGPTFTDENREYQIQYAHACGYRD